ncbi:hypothetical protein, partial [Pseudomonas aeruginosa]|uniref:hypothetical protein n=1 Tax=Pseudomonas aeruginosa TaxID=287 RepID=UPI001E3DF789
PEICTRRDLCGTYWPIVACRDRQLRVDFSLLRLAACGEFLGAAGRGLVELAAQQRLQSSP